ncbi:MAG: T9SS type A sorting domain-containing protein [Saprospiraceae bacterium]|nr:T9SS type A sorting domain-containing protein [Saprospiraceae bacterium]
MNQFSSQDQDDELICFPPIPILSDLNKTTKTNEFYVVPNPADQTVRLHAAENLKVIEAALINEQGKVLMKFSGKTIPNSIDIKSIQNGLYYLRFLTENDQYFVKFMKL